MRKSEALMAFALLGGAAMSAWLWQSRESERRRSNELLARIAVLEQSATAAAPVHAAASASPESVPALPTTSQPPSAKPPPIVQEELIKEQRRLSDPHYRAAAHRLQRAEYGTRKRDLMRALQITAEQADRILDYWAARDVIMQESGLQTAASTNMQQIDAVNERRERALEAEEQTLRAALGGATVDKLLEYDASMQSRRQVDELRAQLAQAGNSMRDEQIEPLVTLLHAEEKRLESEARAFQSTLDMNSEDPRRIYFKLQAQRLALTDERNERLLAAARNVLSEVQVRQLDELLEQQLESERARTLLLEMQSGQSADATLAKEN